MRFSRAFFWLTLGLGGLGLSGFTSIAHGQGASAAAQPAGKSAGVSCQVDHAPASAADMALSRREYDAALGLYRGMETESPDASKAGVIRTLLAQGKVREAEDHAKQWTAAAPTSGLAMETWGEVLFREGQLPEALRTVLDSQKLSFCNPRAYLVAGRVEGLAGNHATAARQFKVAHLLAPNDLDIDQEFTSTLPRSQQIEHAHAVTKEEGLLNVRQRKELIETLDHTKDYSKDDCKLLQPVASAEMHMEEILEDSNHRQSFGLYVKFDGKQRTLEIDSGASGILLSREAAARMGLVRGEVVYSGGVGDQGSAESFVAHVPSIRIGDMEFQNCPITVLSKHDELGVDGLIGTDFFRKYLVTLDFYDRKLRLTPLPPRPGETGESAAQMDDPEKPVFRDQDIPPVMQTWTKVWRIGHEMFVPVAINKTKEKLFLVDTGASLMAVSTGAAHEFTKVHGDPLQEIVGVSGEVAKTYITEDFLVTVARIRLHVQSMESFEMSSLARANGFDTAGFLGAPVLNRMTLQIDYRDNLVNFDYDPKRDPNNAAPLPFY